MSAVCVLGQGTQVIRTPLTTNNVMNEPADLMIPFWNAAAKKWSNAVNNAATATNAQPPSTVLTNLSNTGAITNLNDNQFDGESTIAAIKNGALMTNTINRGWTNLSGGFSNNPAAFFGNFMDAQGPVTNRNGLTVHNDPILLVNTNTEGAEFRMTTYDSLFPSFIVMRRARGTVASPSQLFAGDVIADIDMQGYSVGAGTFGQAMIMEVFALNDWSGTARDSLVKFRLGTHAGGAGQLTWSWTRYNSTNDANLVVNSNLLVGVGSGLGGLYVAGNSLIQGDLTNNGLATLNGVLVGGGFNALGALNTFAQDLTVNGPLIANESFRMPRGGAVTTDEFGEIAADDNAWAVSRGAIQFFDGTANTFLIGVLASDTPSNGQVPKWNTDGTITWEDDGGSGGGGPGTLPMNSNQFDTNNPVSIKNGALVTNLISRGITVPTVTADRAAGFNGNGDLTNSPAVSMAELEFLDGVTSAIQTQLNGKQNGQTNATFFGPSIILTPRDGAVITNLNAVGTIHATNNPVLRFWTTGDAYTEFSLPSSWAGTNKVVFWQTNAQVGHVWKVHSVSISGGLATVNMTNDFLAGTQVTFSDPNNDFAATDITTAIAELVSANGSGPNASDGKVNWSQLVSVPAGFADGVDAGSTNVPVMAVGTLHMTNAVIHEWVHLGNDTNVVVDWNRTNYYVASPSNIFTVVWQNTPSQGSQARSVTLEIVNTNSTAAYFPTNGLNNTPVTMLAAPSTNFFFFNFDGTNLWTESGQILTSGLGDVYVMNSQPVVTNITLLSTNAVAGSFGYTVAAQAGTGTGTTNYVLDVRSNSVFVINAQSGDDGVNIVAVYGGAQGLAHKFSIIVTNAAANEGILFSQVTNNWVWPYRAGGVAPTILTNSEQLLVNGILLNTNVIVEDVEYLPWP